MTYEIANPDDPRYGDEQLRPLKGGRYKTVFKGPPGTEIGDLHCDLEPYIEGDRPAVINHSGWQPNEQQVAMLAAGGHVRLAVYQQPIPPLAVSVEPPVCTCHDLEMWWAPGARRFICQKEAEHAYAEAVDDRAEDQVRRDFRPADGGGDD